MLQNTMPKVYIFSAQPIMNHASVVEDTIFIGNDLTFPESHGYITPSTVLAKRKTTNSRLLEELNVYMTEYQLENIPYMVTSTLDKKTTEEDQREIEYRVFKKLPFGDSNLRHEGIYVVFVEQCLNEPSESKISSYFVTPLCSMKSFLAGHESNHRRNQNSLPEAQKEKMRFNSDIRYVRWLREKTRQFAKYYKADFYTQLETKKD